MLIMMVLILLILVLLSKIQSLVTLSAEDNQKLSKLPREGFASSVYWNEYKTKIETKNMTDE